MHKRPAPTIATALTLLLFAAVVSAEPMRCGTYLIERGLTFFEVLERCGKADLEYSWDQSYAPGVQARVTEWVYEQGPNKFRRVLTFEEGRVRDIELRPHPKMSIKSLP